MLLEVGLLGFERSDVVLHLSILTLLVLERAFQLLISTIVVNNHKWLASTGEIVYLLLNISSQLVSNFSHLLRKSTLKLILFFTEMSNLVVVEVDLFGQSLSGFFKSVNLSFKCSVVDTDLSGGTHVRLLTSNDLRSASDRRSVCKGNTL